MQAVAIVVAASAVLASASTASAATPHRYVLLDARTGRVVQSVSVPADVTNVVFLDPRTGRPIAAGSSDSAANPLWLGR
jgi:hypothetical protein